VTGEARDERKEPLHVRLEQPCRRSPISEDLEMVLAFVKGQTLHRAQPGLSLTQGLSSTSASAAEQPPWPWRGCAAPGRDARQGGGASDAPGRAGSTLGSGHRHPLCLPASSDSSKVTLPGTGCLQAGKLFAFPFASSASLRPHFISLCG